MDRMHPHTMSPPLHHMLLIIELWFLDLTGSWKSLSLFRLYAWFILSPVRPPHRELYLISDIRWVLDLPWIGAIILIMNQPQPSIPNVQSLGSVIFYFASSRRIGLHMFSVVIRNLLTPLLRLLLGIAVSQLLRLSSSAPRTMANPSQQRILRRYINSVLLSQETLANAFRILGTHFENVSVSVLTSLVSVQVNNGFTRWCIDCWGRKSAGESTGPLVGFIVVILSCWTSEMMLFLAPAQSFLRQIKLAPLKLP